MTRYIPLALLLIAGCVPPPGPRPEPVPPVNYDAVVLQVLKDYANGCGTSLVDTPPAESEAAYNEALFHARKAARLKAHGPEDLTLDEFDGDAAKVKELGEAWLRLAKKLESVR